MSTCTVCRPLPTPEHERFRRPRHEIQCPTRRGTFEGRLCAQGTGIGSKGSIVFRQILTLKTIWGICSSLDRQPKRPQQFEFCHRSSVSARVLGHPLVSGIRESSSAQEMTVTVHVSYTTSQDPGFRRFQHRSYLDCVH